MRTDGHRTMPLVRSESVPNTAHSRQTLPSPSPFTQKPIRAANLRAEGRADLIPSGIRIVTAGCKLFYSNLRDIPAERSTAGDSIDSARSSVRPVCLRLPPQMLTDFFYPLPLAQVKTTLLMGLVD